MTDHDEPAFVTIESGVDGDGLFADIVAVMASKRFMWPDFAWVAPSVRAQAHNRQVKWAYVWYEHAKMCKGTRHKRCPKLRNITRHIAEAHRRGILVTTPADALLKKLEENK